MSRKVGRAGGNLVIVCQCRVVNDHAVAVAVAAGAGSVAQVSRATGAGRDCGSCVFALKDLVCQHRLQEQLIVEVEGAAS